MKRKSPHFVVIDLFNLKQTTIEQSKIEVATIVGMHRNSIDFEQDKIYGHYLVLPRFINKINRSHNPGNIINFNKNRNKPE